MEHIESARTARQGLIFTISCLAVLLVSGIYAAFAIQSLRTSLELHRQYMAEREKRLDPILTESVNTIKSMNLLISQGIVRQDEVIRNQAKILDLQERLMSKK